MKSVRTTCECTGRRANLDFNVAFVRTRLTLSSAMAHSAVARFQLVLWLAFLPVLLLAETGDTWLGDPPPAPTPQEVLALKRVGPRPLSRTGPFVVDTSSREQVRLFHQSVYDSAEGVEPSWTGDAAACQAGTISPDFQDAVVRRINYFRALAGVPAGVVLDPVLNAKDQEAALMMSVNNALTHFPPVSWSCYTADGAEAARNSNLAIGRFGSSAIDAYMEDFGSGNAAVGHRRWLLYPQTQTMGAGDVPATGPLRSANAVWVFDGHFGGPRPVTRTPYVTWPPAGYVPYPVVYSRWSFSYSDANFSGATVSLTRDGLAVPVITEPPSGNTGENSLVWYPADLNPNTPHAWPRPTSDTVYEVAVRGVLVVGSSRDYTYQVTVFDPSTVGADTVLPEITGPIQPVVGQSNRYTVSTVPIATAHQYRASRRAAFTAVDGAENGAGRFMVNTSSGYEVVVTTPKASGLQAYHLAHPTFTPQYLTYLPVLVAGPAALLEFQSRLGWASPNQVARAQVLLGGTGTWQDIYAQPGSAGRGETSFNLRSVSLAPFAGRSLQIRFVYDRASGVNYYAGDDPGVGWYLDDIAVHHTEELLDSVVPAPFQAETFDWNPPDEGDYALEARAQVFDDFYAEWGPIQPVSAVIPASPPLLRFLGPPILATDHFEIEFTVENHQPGLSLELLRADGLEAIWTVDISATFETLTPASHFRVRTPISGSAPSEYFRLRSN